MTDTFALIASRIADVHLLVNGLQRDPSTAIEGLRRALGPGSGTAAEAIWTLALLPPRFTKPLIGELISRSISERYGGEARWLLGRLPHAEAAQVVPGLVHDELRQPGADYFTYHQLASLLDHLGLVEALAELVLRASASDDPDIREVADDFRAPSS